MEKIAQYSRLLADNIDLNSLKEFLEQIYQHEKTFSHEAFKMTSAYCLNALKDMGVKAEYFNIPFDGETKIADWTMPLAWDVEKATLAFFLDGEEIGQLDVKDIPHYLYQWSAGTPEEGVTAEVKWIDDPDQISVDSVKGCFVLTTLSPLAVKKRVADAGGLGVIRYNPKPRAPKESVPWGNCWADDPDGWVFTAKDTPLTGFSISQELGEQFKEYTLSDKKFTVKATVDTKLFKGEVPLVVGEIPGTSDESVLLLGHLFEPGANDNGSGTAGLLEIARLISGMIRNGDLPPLKRGIKFLFTSEIYGTLQFAQQLTKDKSIIAGLNLDCIGRLDHSSGKMVVAQLPDSAASFIPGFFAELAEMMNLTDEIELSPFCLGDNLISDPQIGIPCAHIGGIGRYWHTSMDVPEKIDFDLMSRFTAFGAAYAYFFATAGKDEACWLGDLLFNEHKKRTHESVELKRYQEFLTKMQLQSIRSIDESESTQIMIENTLQLLSSECPDHLSGSDEQNLAENTFDKIVPVRRFKSPLSFLDIPFDERSKNNINVWNITLQKALFWIDGERSIQEIIRLTELEHKCSLPWLSGALQILLKHGLLIEKISFDRIVSDLREMGVSRGDTIGVHSSLKAIGYVDGGAETVIKALLEVIGSEGTLLMPLFNDPAPVVDLRTTPCRLGAIPEAFRTFPGVLRSNNATHSVGVIGAEAEYLAAGHHSGTQLGVDSPFHRLAKIGGSILHIGTSFRSSSIIHVAEAIRKVPFLDIAYDGYGIPIEFTAVDGTTHVMQPKETPGDSVSFIKIDQVMKDKNLLVETKVGMADSFLAEGQAILDVAGEMLVDDPEVFLCDNPECVVCTTSRNLSNN